MKPPFLPFITISILFISILHLHSSPATAAHPNVLVDACKNCSDTDPNVDFNLCIAILGSVPASHQSDLHGLTLISLKLAVKNATGVKSELKQLLKAKPKNPYLVSCLQACKELYSDAVGSIKKAKKAIKVERFSDVNVYLSSVVDAPGTCEEGFQDGGVTSPVTEKNKEFFELAVISLALSNLLAK